MKAKVFLNSISNISDFIVTVLITLALTPIYLKSLGHYDYGIWDMVNSVIGYMGLLDLGLRASVTRYVSVLNSEKKHKEINQLFSTALTYMSIVGVVFFTVFWFWGNFSPETLSETNSNETKYKLFLMLIGCSVFIIFIRNAIEGTLEGKQLYIIKNTANLVIKVVSAVYLYFNLTPENALILLAQTVVLAGLARVVFFNILLFIHTPSVNPFVLPSFEVFMKLFRFGTKSLINGIGLAVEQASGAFLIGILISPAAIPMYSIPLALTRYIVNFIESASSVLMPYFAELNIKDSKMLHETYLFFSKTFIWFLFTACVFMINFGTDFIDVWLGGQFKKADIEWLVLLMSCSVLLEKINPLGVRISTALNKHGIFARLRPISALGVFSLSYFFISWVGVSGAIYAKMIMLLIFTPIFLKHSLRLINTNTLSYTKACIVRNIGTFIILTIYSQLYLMNFLVNSYGSILAAFISLTLISIILLLYVSYTKDERQWVLSFINK